MKKFTFNAVAMAVATFASAGAYAVVDLQADPAAPAVFAKEIVATVAAPVTLTNNGGVISLKSTLGYSFSAGEVRYVRVELANGKFAAAPTVTPSNASTSIGAVNGGGTSVIYFSVTSDSTNASPSIAGDTFTVASDITITGTASNVTATYSLYDQPSQAQAGGTSGRIVNVADKALVSFAPSYSFVGTAADKVAEVTASPAYTTIQTGLGYANLGTLVYKLPTTVPNKAAGTSIALADFMKTGATGTTITVTGDFSAAANANGTYTGAALNKVALSASATCASSDVPASTLSATSATFQVGATATTGTSNLCYIWQSGAYVASTYKASINAVAASATYAPTNAADQTMGAITRNGTQLQAPLFQTTSGYVSRFFLTNTGSTAASYTVAIQGETGNTLTAGTTTGGTIPANGSLEVKAADVLAGTTGAPRATANFTINAPTSAIQGVYQIVNQTSGAISNMGMLRPGSN